MWMPSVLTLETVVLGSTVLFLIWYYVHTKWQYFEKQGIPYMKPTVLKAGSTVDILQDVFGYDYKAKEKCGPIHGQFLLLKPSFTVHDPDLLRRIFIKEFSNFSIRTNILTKSNGPEVNESLTQVQGEKWKRTRASMSPVFSSSKLKQMFNILEDCSTVLLKILEKRIENNEGCFNAKNLFGRYSLDVVLSAAFSTESHLQDETEEEPEIVKQAKKIANIQLLRSPKILLLILFPWLETITSKFDVTIFDSEASEYFRKLTREIIKRKKNNPNSEPRADLMQFMLDLEMSNDELARFTGSKGMSKTEIMGNAFLMIVAGYENTANTIGFVAYNLAMHPEVQKRLQEEVDNALNETGKLTYSALHSMKYLDMCVNESLRLYSPVLRNARICTKETTINGILFEKGIQVNIPTFSLHRDPEFWDKPLEFNPERMSDMSSIDPMVFQPFGQGPRNCIAMRFARMEVKLAIADIVSKFTLLPGENTPKPPLPLKFSFAVQPKEELFLKVVNRKA